MLFLEASPPDSSTLSLSPSHCFLHYWSHPLINLSSSLGFCTVSCLAVLFSHDSSASPPSPHLLGVFNLTKHAPLLAHLKPASQFAPVPGNRTHQHQQNQDQTLGWTSSVWQPPRQWAESRTTPVATVTVTKQPIPLCYTSAQHNSISRHREQDLRLVEGASLWESSSSSLYN